MFFYYDKFLGLYLEIKMDLEYGVFWEEFNGSNSLVQHYRIIQIRNSPPWPSIQKSFLLNSLL